MTTDPRIIVRVDPLTWKPVEVFYISETDEQEDRLREIAVRILSVFDDGPVRVREEVRELEVVDP